jgi:glucan phosphoethanolaminetransferase (alkaline phosphatase superfamily)
MKVTFPKNIQKWLLAGMTLNMGPISLSIIQLFLVAVWFGLALAVFQWVSKSGSSAAGIVFAIPILIIFLLIAFFKVSEMGLLQYVAKMFRNKFFDTSKKYQSNFERYNKTEILIKEFKQEDQKKKIQQKESKMDDSILDNIKKWWLMWD